MHTQSLYIDALIKHAFKLGTPIRKAATGLRKMMGGSAPQELTSSGGTLLAARDKIGMLGVRYGRRADNFQANRSGAQKFAAGGLLGLGVSGVGVGMLNSGKDNYQRIGQNGTYGDGRRNNNFIAALQQAGVGRSFAENNRTNRQYY